MVLPQEGKLSIKRSEGRLVRTKNTLRPKAVADAARRSDRETARLIIFVAILWAGIAVLVVLSHVLGWLGDDLAFHGPLVLLQPRRQLPVSRLQVLQVGHHLDEERVLRLLLRLDVQPENMRVVAADVADLPDGLKLGVLVEDGPVQVGAGVAAGRQVLRVKLVSRLPRGGDHPLPR